MLNLRKLFADVFDPQPGETAAVFVDLPHGEIGDTDAWRERRAMAERWHAALSEFGTERQFDVLPLVTFEATGMNNGQLPERGSQNGVSVVLEQIGARTSLLLALTEFSASAPLIGWTKRMPQLRAASMPRVAPRPMSARAARSAARPRRSIPSTRTPATGA